MLVYTNVLRLCYAPMVLNHTKKGKVSMTNTSHNGEPRPSNLGKLILQYRRRRSITQEQLAEDLCISRETISHLENGRITMPEYGPLRAIVRTLNIPGMVILRALDLLTESDSQWLADTDKEVGGAIERHRRGRPLGSRSKRRSQPSTGPGTNNEPSVQE